MGSRWETSEAAKYYAKREKVLGNGINLLSIASTKIDKLSKDELTKLGDIAAFLLPHSPGYAGKLMPIIARLYWKIAGSGEREFKYIDLDDLDKMIEELRTQIESK